MTFKFLYPLYAPNEDAITVVEDKPPLGDDKEKFDDDVELMESLIGDKDLIDLDKKEDKEDKKEDKEEKEEVEEPELEIEEPDTNARAIDLAKIKEKYPDFAKTNEFRELRNAYHREAKYTELFPTIEDAEEAAENNETYNKLNTDLIEKGDSLSLLESLKEASPESLRKVANSFLDNVMRVDNNLFNEIISPVVKRLARQIHGEGQKFLRRNAESDEGKALVATARNILQYYFEDSEGIDKEEPKPSNEPSEKEKELQAREQALLQKDFQNSVNVVVGTIEKNLEKQILQGLDPDGKFNEFTRDTLLEKIKESVKKQLDNDSHHVKKMTSLWKRAGSEGYNRDSLSRIVAAYLERARPIIPTERSRFRSIAIKGKPERDTEDKSVSIATRGRSGRAPANDGKVNIKAVDTKKIDYRQTSDEDIFEGKVKLKAH